MENYNKILKLLCNNDETNELIINPSPKSPVTTSGICWNVDKNINAANRPIAQ